jgi:hypothetical protein
MGRPFAGVVPAGAAEDLHAAVEARVAQPVQAPADADVLCVAERAHDRVPAVAADQPPVPPVCVQDLRLPGEVGLLAVFADPAAVPVAHDIVVQRPPDDRLAGGAGPAGGERPSGPGARPMAHVQAGQFGGGADLRHGVAQQPARYPGNGGEPAERDRRVLAVAPGEQGAQPSRVDVVRSGEAAQIAGDRLVAERRDHAWQRPQHERPFHGSGRAGCAGLRRVIDRDAVEQLAGDFLGAVHDRGERGRADQMGQAADHPAGALMQVRA